MKKLITAAIILHLFICATIVHAATSPARGAFLAGLYPSPLGRGGTGVASQGTGFFSINPASVSGTESFTIGINYGSPGGDFSQPSLLAALPFSYGVFAMNFSYFSMSEGDQEQKGYYVSAGISREITARFFFGLSVESMYSDYDGTDYYVGVRPGLRYIVGSAGPVTGFGVHDFTLGLSPGIGVSSSGEADLNSVTAGYSFGFYRERRYSLGFYNDFSAVNSYSDYPVKLGLEAVIYRNLSLRGGMVIPAGYEYMDYTCGAGYAFAGDIFRGSLDYAIVYSEDNGINHYAGLTMEIGRIDREPPVISIEPDYSYISPNYDGVQDYLIFSIDVQDASSIKGWRLQIIDDSDLTVREFKISEREIEEGLTPASFMRRFLGRKDSLTVPQKILWDGSDGSGRKLPDGRYRYYFYAWDSKDNIAPVRSGAVNVDGTSPLVTVSADSLIFSPNGDKKKDTLAINQNITTSPDDIWRCEIKNAGGITVFSKEWTGKAVPQKFTWDGTDSKGELAPDGLYYYSISSGDKAGNSASAELREITLTTKMEIADVRTNTAYFSYRKTPGGSIRFFPELSSVKGLERWELSVYGTGEKPLRTISGGSALPGFIDWDCMDSEGKNLDDNAYSVKFSAFYASGNNPESFPKQIVFDSAPPEVKISHDPALFSPDSDGENDYLTLDISGKDNTGIERWEIGIYSESGVLFKKFSGRGDIPAQLKWDGVGEKGELVESASDYDIQLSAVDAAGNSSETAADRMSVDVLVVVTERGLKIRISNIEFGYDSSTIKKRGASILDRVYQILEKYGAYNVVIEGHTDDLGTEEYNLTLSEKRALAVRDYLMRRGTSPERLSYVGMGESLPFYPNSDDENRRRNRRVEFLLNKKKIE